MSLHRAFVLTACILIALPASLVPALADCRDDLVGADQSLRKTRSAMKNTDGATDAVLCTAYRRHVSALQSLRNVMARCDTGQNKAQHVAAIDGEISTYNQRAQSSCKR